MINSIDKQFFLVCEIASRYRKSADTIYSFIRAKKISHDAIVLKRFKVGTQKTSRRCKAYDVKKFEAFYAA